MPYDHLLENVVSGVLTGGATAVTAIVSFFRDTKKRVTDLEARGNAWDNRLNLLTGKFSPLEVGPGIVQQVSQLKIDFDDWKSWLMQNYTAGLPPMRASMPTPRQSFVVNLDQIENEDYRLTKIERTLKELRDRLDEMESSVHDQEKALRESDGERSDQIHKIREEIASVNGVMRGLATAMGLYKSNL